MTTREAPIAPGLFSFILSVLILSAGSSASALVLRPVNTDAPGAPSSLAIERVGIEPTKGIGPARIERKDPGGRSFRPRRRDSKPPTPGFHVQYENEATFDRVSGLTLWGGVSGSGTDDYIPEIRMITGYSFSRERWSYDAGVLQPVLPARYLMLGAEGHHYIGSRAFDRDIVGNTENSLAGIFFKEDYRDHYESTAEAFVVESRAAGNKLRVSLGREEITSVPVGTHWSLFYRDRPFRSNPPVNDGEARCYQASYTLDLRATEDPDAHSRGFLGMLSAERAGRWGLDGDFRYDRYVADFRHYSKLGPQIYLDVRLMGGALEPVSDVHYLYPVHKEFYVGGIGTLPGYSYKAFRGERMMLANAEYRFGDRPAFLLTADAGDAWTPGEREFELHTDVGAGFELSAEELRIMVGRRLDEPDADPIWRLRLNRTF